MPTDDPVRVLTARPDVVARVVADLLAPFALHGVCVDQVPEVFSSLTTDDAVAWVDRDPPRSPSTRSRRPMPGARSGWAW